MPPAATTQSLFRILPFYTSDTLPGRLTYVAEALLAQSRHRAAHLKPEEEIARAYACADIAARKLKVQLRLPNRSVGKGPPCKPAVYKKLIALFEKILDQDLDSLLSTPKKRKAEEPRPAERAPTPAETPTKKQKTTPASTAPRRPRATPTKFSGTIASSNTDVDANSEAPSYVPAIIRALCKTYHTPTMFPHVYTGVCTILRLASLWPATDSQDMDPTASISPKSDITAITIAVYLMVLTRMQRGQITTKILNSVSEKALALFPKDLENRKQIESRIEWLNQNEYCRDQPWYESVPRSVLDFNLRAAAATSPADVLIEDEDTEDDNDDPDEDQDSDVDDQLLTHGHTAQLDADAPDPEDVLLPGLATMMQDNVDWLSESRTAAFLRWKRDFLRDLDRHSVQQSGGSRKGKKGKERAREVEVVG